MAKNENLFDYDNIKFWEMHNHFDLLECVSTIKTKNLYVSGQKFLRAKNLSNVVFEIGANNEYDMNVVNADTKELICTFSLTDRMSKEETEKSTQPDVIDVNYLIAKSWYFRKMIREMVVGNKNVMKWNVIDHNIKKAETYLRRFHSYKAVKEEAKDVCDVFIADVNYCTDVIAYVKEFYKAGTVKWSNDNTVSVNFTE